MHIEYQITEDDFASAGRLAVQTKSKFAAIQRYGVIAAISQQALSGLWAGLIWGSLLLGIAVLYGFYGYQFRRVYRKAPLLSDRRSPDVDDRALHFKTANSEGRSPWEAHIKFAEDENTFILFQQDNQIFIPIPKRELTVSQIDELRTLLETHLSRK